MLKNYLKVAFRTLRRNKGYTAINVGGLAVGLAACLLVYAFIQHETSFDEHHPAAERTYRIGAVYDQWMGEDGPKYEEDVPVGLVPALRRRVPGVERAAQLDVFYGEASVKAAGQFFTQPRVTLADTAFFEMFDYRMLAGAADRLAAPNTAVLTESVARRYFGSAAGAVGRSVRLGEDRTVEVVGVAEDPPAQTHLPFRFFLSYVTAEPDYGDWSFADGHVVYITLRGGASPEQVEERINAVRRQHQSAEVRASTRYALQPVTEIHTEPRYDPYPGAYATNPAHLWGLGIIGVVIALLAVVNFVNLATAQATRRAREVGVRKAIGGTRGQLAAQFMGEATLLTFGAALIGWLAAFELLPLFGRIFELEVARATLLGPQALLSASGATLLTALLAGVYPALVLSGYRPAAVLKGNAGGRSLRGARLRKGLTVFQLAAAQVLLVGTLVVAWQMHYVQSKDLGFEPEARLTVDVPRDSSARARFREALAEQPDVRGVTYVMGAPTKESGSFSTLTAQRAPGDTMRSVRTIPIDAQYLDVYGIDLLAGRGLRAQEEHAPANRVALVNRAMAKQLGRGGAPAEALGTVLRSDDFSVRVVGVTENFHQNSLRQEIEPALMLHRPEFAGYAGIALNPKRMGEGLAQAEAAFARVFPDTHFEYEFLSGYLRSLYQNERRVTRAFWVFTALAVFIACLGLFGLAAFAAERRRKEIAVRKTFGASTRQLVGLLSKDFLKLVAVGFVLAAPVAYFAMQRWLDGFAYRVELGPLVFLAAGALALVVALGATGAQALRAARANPAQALRDE